MLKIRDDRRMARLYTFATAGQEIIGTRASAGCWKPAAGTWKLAPMSDTPKSSYELVMERLRKKDAEAGIEEKPLTDEQRTAIAEARSVYDSKVAERRIMHQSAVASVFDPAELAERDSELRRDLERFASERDAKIKRIRES